MKKFLFGLWVAALPVSAVFAETIDFYTQVQWNSLVVTEALTRAGFIDSEDANNDVRLARNRILENLLSRNKFSLHDASDVCMAKCNMSDLLKNGQGQNGKRCPDLCVSFVENIITVNNLYYDGTHAHVNGLEMPHAGWIEGHAQSVCMRLTAELPRHLPLLTLPVLCGGTCNRMGDDIVKITDIKNTLQFTVDDFCEGDKHGDYFYVMPDAEHAINVSDLTEQQRLTKLKEVQTQPASDYLKKRQTDTFKEKQETYAQRVERNGYCKEQAVKHFSQEPEGRQSCKYYARKFAQANACKLKSYYSFGASGGYEVSVECYVNGVMDADEYPVSPVMKERDAQVSKADYFMGFANYDYAPSYEDCVPTFSEADCDGIAQGQYKSI